MRRRMKVEKELCGGLDLSNRGMGRRKMKEEEKRDRRPVFWTHHDMATILLAGHFCVLPLFPWTVCCSYTTFAAIIGYCAGAEEQIKACLCFNYLVQGICEDHYFIGIDSYILYSCA